MKKVVLDWEDDPFYIDGESRLHLRTLDGQSVEVCFARRGGIYAGVMGIPLERVEDSILQIRRELDPRGVKADLSYTPIRWNFYGGLTVDNLNAYVNVSASRSDAEELVRYLTRFVATVREAKHAKAA
mgnify:FL=1